MSARARWRNSIYRTRDRALGQISAADPDLKSASRSIPSHSPRKAIRRAALYAVLASRHTDAACRVLNDSYGHHRHDAQMACELMTAAGHQLGDITRLLSRHRRIQDWIAVRLAAVIAGLTATDEVRTLPLLAVIATGCAAAVLAALSTRHLIRMVDEARLRAVPTLAPYRPAVQYNAFCIGAFKNQVYEADWHLRVAVDLTHRLRAVLPTPPDGADTQATRRAARAESHTALAASALTEAAVHVRACLAHVASL